MRVSSAPGLAALQGTDAFGQRALTRVRNFSLARDGFAPILAGRLCGGIAQLVERLVRNEKVRGSNPLTSTLVFAFCGNALSLKKSPPSFLWILSSELLAQL